MKISYNYVSLVALGNFNPAIATPDFLNEVCELNLGEPTSISPQVIPVHRQISFKNLVINVHLDRLDIKDVGAKDLYGTQIIEIFKRYYEKLPFTPINAVGININGELGFEKDDQRKNIEARISDPNLYLEFFNIEKIILSEHSIYGRDKKILKSSDYRIENLGNLTRIINVVLKKNTCSLNYNCEAGNLKKSEERLVLLLDNFTQFCDEFHKFINVLEK